MKYYKYDEETNIFLYSADADIDPLESELAKHEVYLLPTFSTTIEQNLEPQENKQIIFNFKNNQWEYIDDYRGKNAITNDGKIYVIKELGSTTDKILSDEELKELNSGQYEYKNGQIIKKEKTLDELKQEKRDERDYILETTDKFMLIDYPIDDNTREKYKQYRQYLRDITEDKRFPYIEIMTFEQFSRI